MSWTVVCLVALVASTLTLFSGFGLGTLLLPAFALIFPVELAVAATAVVHLANNLFKLALIGSHARIKTVLAFGLPALIGALGGAWLLTELAELAPISSYSLAGRSFEISGLKLALGALIISFAIVELRPAGRAAASGGSSIGWGGLASGFFGGLSGHQGALRSAYLIRAGLSKESFIATGVGCALLVDLARVSVYGLAFFTPLAGQEYGGAALKLLAAATLCAFLGAWVGVRLVHKVTLVSVRRLVGAMLILVGLGMAAGWL